MLSAVLTSIAVLLAGSLPAHAQQRDEVASAHNELEQLAKDLAQLKQVVEEHEEGRLIVLDELRIATRESLRTNGLAHSRTFRSYQTLIISFRHSKEYFDRILTQSTATTTHRITLTIEEMAKKRGIDEAASLITHSVFSNLEKLFRDLLADSSLPLNLRQAMEDKFPSIGMVTAKSARGDWADVYDLSRPVALELATLLPLFKQIAGTDTKAKKAANIQGLIDFYMEFSSAEKLRRTQ